jgi:hypothetical protein
MPSIPQLKSNVINRNNFLKDSITKQRLLNGNEARKILQNKVISQIKKAIEINQIINE